MSTNESNKTIVFIAFGSNLGDREATIHGALRELEINGLSLSECSKFIETVPVDCPGNQGLYINGVAKMLTTLRAADLLNLLLKVEKKFGRIRVGIQQNEARCLDLDLLLYGDEVINIKGLCVPHPRMHLRNFVLDPLVEIAPNKIHPVLKRSIKNLHQALTPDS